MNELLEKMEYIFDELITLQNMIEENGSQRQWRQMDIITGKFENLMYDMKNK